MVKFYIYSEIKEEFFYLNQPVKDTETNDVGYIYNLDRDSGLAKEENIIKVQYEKYKKIYFSKEQINLEKVNPE